MRKTALLIISLFLLLSYNSYAQEDNQNEQTNDSINSIKHIGLGIKIGIPNLVGGFAEVILPFFNNHFATFVDYSSFPVGDDIKISPKYLEYGVNYYFGEKGHGLFISVSKSNFDGDITYKELSFGEGIKGSGSTELNFNTTNFKLGLKSGGRFYFRFELGYGMGDIPNQLDFIATASGITKNFTEEISVIPGLVTSGVLIGNIGFGYSF